MATFVDYCPANPEIVITNLDQLPKRLGCKLLLAVESPYPGEYAAKRWLRKMPTATARCEVVIRF
jgi:hypothetical protein